MSGRSDHDRLRVISEIHDGRTCELLVRAGFGAGHRFVEFGYSMLHPIRPVEAIRTAHAALPRALNWLPK